MKFPNVDLSTYIRSLATTESNGKSVSIWPIELKTVFAITIEIRIRSLNEIIF